MPVDAASLALAASFLRAGDVVAFPTETVYGLGADARNAEAVAKIFAAKGRPADNPLIVHIANEEQLNGLVTRVSARARALMARFWPGPLTLIFGRTDAVPDIVSAGLSTVAVRVPAHPAAQALLRAAGCPIAAPSANVSGRPSPTLARHVLQDMQGRIPLIIDGGAAGVGVESTVMDISGDVPIVLRPGGVTVEMLREVLPEVRVDDAVLSPLAQGVAARSPGMKHRHYAPRAHMAVVRGEADAVRACVAARYDALLAGGKTPVILCRTGRAAAYGGREAFALGEDIPAMTANLFDALRALDARGATHIIAEATETEGMGLALMNRLLRAADFDVIDA